MREIDCFLQKKKDEFISALENIEQVQLEVLKKILTENSKTEYGKTYDFDNISSIKDFQSNVPITTYESYAGFIEKIAVGETNVLTSEDVKIFEPSSGSTQASKLIPYTEGLKKDFNKGIEPWLSDVYLNTPELRTAPAYWSITPSFKKYSYTKGGIKIGFDNDAQYLSDEFALLIQETMFIPECVSRIQDIELFKQVTILFLLAQENLSLISIWNPSLFLVLLDELKSNTHKIITDINNDSLPSGLEDGIINEIKSVLKFSDKRKSELCKIFSQDDIDFASLWKNLKLISCWADANAKGYAQKLQQIFPNTVIQPKGLLATEGIMTVPIENIGRVPCVKSHFFEFIEQDIVTSEIKLTHELELGKTYSIILTTSGGLYRYEIGDIVRVYDKRGNCPCLEFLGKKDNVSDYFGEKINELHIKSIIEKFNIDKLSTFYLFAPKKSNDKLFYALYIESEDIIAKQEFQKLETGIEKELLKNFHYKYCRDLNQLQAFKVFCVKEDISALDKYLQICTNRGLKLGDIKPAFFSNQCNWDFKGELV